MADKIKFLGTAGARIVVAKQLRSSGGTWITLDDKNLLLDPGPGTLARCAKSRPPLDPTGLDAIILSHQHIDHANDVNIMIEAMTNGGFSRKGALFAPLSALENDPIVLRYVRDYVDEIHVLTEGSSYTLGDVSISTPLRHIHPASGRILCPVVGKWTADSRNCCGKLPPGCSKPPRTPRSHSRNPRR